MEINSPKAVMRQGYADGILLGEASWLSLLNDRNSAPHIYDDATAQRIFDRIQNTYISLLKDLINRLR